MNKNEFINRIITQSYEDYLKNEYRFSIINACTALELAIDAFYNNKNELEYTFKQKFSSFNNLPLLTRAITVLLTAKAPDKVPIVSYFIDLRNSVVHDGYEPTDNFDYELNDFLEIISKYILNENHKFPSHNHGNALERINQNDA